MSRMSTRLIAASLLLAACQGVSPERLQAQAPATYHIEYYQISER